jgi:anti-anti-sigma factor
MGIEVSHVRSHGIEVVAISGKIVGSAPASEAFHELFRQQLESGKRKFVIDLTLTPWTNSLGIGMLMGAHTSVRKSGGEIVLAHASERIHDLLRVTHLHKVFEVFDTVPQALERLGSNLEDTAP